MNVIVVNKKRCFEFYMSKYKKKCHVIDIFIVYIFNVGFYLKHRADNNESDITLSTNHSCVVSSLLSIVRITRKEHYLEPVLVVEVFLLRM